jgi:hypothetical protein
MGWLFGAFPFREVNMTSAVGFPPGTVYQVTNITQGIPAIVTVSSVALAGAFFLANGMVITFSGVLGMYQINRNRYVIGSLDTNAMTFSLYDIQGNPVDTTGFNLYTAGGQVNIISYVAQAGQPPGLMYNTQPITV